MISKDVEYTMLKQEILGLINIQNNYIIAMYTITVTIWGIAYERRSHILFLLSYIILFSFQRIITTKKEGMIRLAAYIVVYLEDGWEKNYHSMVAETLEKRDSKKVFSQFMNMISGRISSLQLGFLCSASSVIMCLVNMDMTISENLILKIKIIDLISLIGAISLYVVLWYWNKNVLKTMKMRSDYIELLKNSDIKV